MVGLLALGQVSTNAQSWAGTPSLVAPWESIPGGEEQGGGSPEVGTVSIKEDTSSSPLWEDGIGGGYRKGTWLGEASAGVGIGMQAFGGREEHDFILSSIQAGRMLTGVLGEGKWYQGNFECFGSLLGGAQINPYSRYLIGLNPGARYHFATGTPVVPFLSLSAGVMATDIKEPDLSTIFQFNEQYGMGLRWYIQEELSLTLEYRLIHISNAGIEKPNAGVNSNLILAGLNWRF